MATVCNPNLILGLDPASHHTGYALVDRSRDPLHPRLVEAGILKGSERRVEVADPVLSQLMNSHGMNATRRIDSICAEVIRLVTQYLPAVIVIEIPSGLAGAGSKSGASSSLSVYGLAVGSVLKTVQNVVLTEVTTNAVYGYAPVIVPVTERLWTRFRKSKSAGQLMARAMYPAYRIEDDEGADISDAIHLTRWFSWWWTQPAEFRAAKLKAAAELGRGAAITARKQRMGKKR